jgi:hypothetical protein
MKSSNSSFLLCCLAYGIIGISFLGSCTARKMAEPQKPPSYRPIWEEKIFEKYRIHKPFHTNYPPEYIAAFFSLSKEDSTLPVSNQVDRNNAAIFTDSPTHQLKNVY